jgi:hypothetical protein
MAPQLQPQHHLSPMSEVSAVELQELQLECAEIAASGGELGAIAAEIARISRSLSELCAQADEFLASPTAS